MCVHRISDSTLINSKSSSSSSFSFPQKVATTTEIGNKSVKNAFKSFGSYQEIFPSFYPLPMMDRGGLDQMSDTNLCLQDLVGNGQTTNHNGNGTLSSSQSNSNDHLHNHHNLHDVSSSVSATSISNLMSPTNVGSLGSGLSHLHHSTHPDLSSHHHHHHHITSPHTPSVLHEPLEKLKCELIIGKFTF